MSIFDKLGAEAGDHLGKSIAEGVDQLLKDKKIRIEVSIMRPAPTQATELTQISAEVSLEPK